MGGALKAALEAEGRDTTMPEIRNMTKSAWLVLECMMMNPGITQKDLAKHLGITRPYVSRIQNSRVFKEKLNEVRVGRLQDRLTEVATKGVERCDEALDDKDVSIKHKIEITKMALTGIGLGANQGSNKVEVTTNIGVNDLGVSREMVEAARKRRQAKLFEGTAEVVEVKDAKE